ncbi:MAG: glycosyltransferase family 2 protein [Sulfuricurvum sp.]|nr:glycosyltransferase family 2 protein [Sulfuricurvum sp.]
MFRNNLISIAMATYNGEIFLHKQLDSILKQTYSNFELIICDDHSTDNTLKILTEYSKHDSRIRIYSNPINIGFVKNFEKALALCTGEYIALADQDDIWEKEKLAVLIHEIGPNLLIHSNCSIIDDQDHVISLYWKKNVDTFVDLKSLLFRNVVTGCTILIKKDLLLTALPFPEEITYHDWWLAICAAADKKICYTDKSLTQYRQHIRQNTGVKSSQNTSVFQDIYSNIIKRFNNIQHHRIRAYQKHHQNLHAIKNIKWVNEYLPDINNAILYFEDYLKNKFHFKTFLISLKYHKILYPYKNYFYIKNFLMDIVG